MGPVAVVASDEVGPGRGARLGPDGLEAAGGDRSTIALAADPDEGHDDGHEGGGGQHGQLHHAEDPGTDEHGHRRADQGPAPVGERPASPGRRRGTAHRPPAPARTLGTGTRARTVSRMSRAFDAPELRLGGEDQAVFQHAASQELDVVGVT